MITELLHTSPRPQCGTALPALCEQPCGKAPPSHCHGHHAVASELQPGGWDQLKSLLQEFTPETQRDLISPRVVGCSKVGFKVSYANCGDMQLSRGAES